MDVFIILAGFRLGAWCIDWPAWKRFALSQTSLDRHPMHRSTVLVFLPRTARDVAAYDCFDGEDVEASNLHTPVQKLLVENMWNPGR